MKHLVLPVIFIIYTFIPCLLGANDFSGQYYELREREIQKFALELFETGEYYRAITEAKRYISLLPQGINVEDMYKLIGDAYLMANEWSDAIEAYKVFHAKFPDSPHSNQVLFSMALCYVKEKNFKQAEILFQTVIDRRNQGREEESILWKILLLLQENRFEEIDKLLDNEFIRQQISTKISIVRQIMEEKKGTSYKSPELAGIMSSVLPGSGQFYDKRYRDGIYSFILNALFIFGAYNAFDGDHYALGGILTLFEVGWYTGNIYNAVNSAHKYNRKVDEDIFRSGVGRFGLLENEIRKTPNMSIIFRFPF